MKEVFLLKGGEMVLKGLNRHTFEDIMVKNARRRLSSLGEFRFWKSQSTIYVEPMDDTIDMDEAEKRLGTVFGVAAYCRACAVPKDWETIRTAALDYLEDRLCTAKTFKVTAKRADKSFPMQSPEIGRELGGAILARHHRLKVDVNHPELTVTVEIREKAAYIHADQLPGAGGIPVGTGGKVMLLLSGGIDSPVAGYMMAKRGMEVMAVHFAAPPYTSDRARQKVEDLGSIMTSYTGRMRLFVVPFTKIQEELRDKGPEEYFTILMRRSMMRIAERIALREGCGGLVTGESLGQVASQTLPALACTDSVTELPILRPLIGMDKSEIVVLSRKIDTFETSILPYEDCCTVFTPRHPKTRPVPAVVAGIEQSIQLDETLIEEAVNTAELVVLGPNAH